MTKARDLANIISGGFTTDDIPNIDASKITSGTFADARISQSSVSQHATSFDDNKIVNDISTLALRQASDQNKSAYNTNSQSVDVFQDDTGIDTTTNVQRNASEYVSSISESQTNGIIPASEGTLISDGVNNGSPISYAFDGSSSINASLLNDGEVANTNSSSAMRVGIDYGSARVVDSVNVKVASNRPFLRNNSNTAVNDILSWEVSNDGSSYSIIDNVATGTSSGVTVSMTNSGGTAYRYHRIKFPSVDTSSDKFVREIEFIGDYTALTVNSTGNFTGTTITAPSSVSSMGAIITYQDNAGTNALNTDIVLQLSADGGSNYSTATLTALPDFSTGIKMAKVNDLAVTAGTQLKYKINFANQANGSKEARIRGVALQY